MTTWRIKIGETMGHHGEGWPDVVASTLTDAQLNKSFDSGYGWPEGAPFTLWTATRVYFPASYDGAEWCASVARYPDDQPTEHVGG